MQNGGLQLHYAQPAQAEADLAAVVQAARQAHAVQQQQFGGELMDEHLLDDNADMEFVDM